MELPSTSSTQSVTQVEQEPATMQEKKACNRGHQFTERVSQARCTTTTTAVATTKFPPPDPGGRGVPTDRLPMRWCSLPSLVCKVQYETRFCKKRICTPRPCLSTWHECLDSHIESFGFRNRLDILGTGQASDLHFLAAAIVCPSSPCARPRRSLRPGLCSLGDDDAVVKGGQDRAEDTWGDL